MGVSCYCGCATWQNRIKWSLSLICLAVGGGMFMIASVILVLKALNCEQNVLTPSEREDCLESPEPADGWSKRCLDVQNKIDACLGADIFKTVTLQLTSYFFMFTGVVLLCMMCCCTEHPMRRNYAPVQSYVAVPAPGAAAEAVESPQQTESSTGAASTAAVADSASQPLLQPA